jgi:RimJ/RimL family protein N-acetyltransferase
LIPDWKYQTKEVAVIPYVSGSKGSPDGLLGHLYLRTKEDKLLETVWAGLPGINFDSFVRQLSSNNVALQIYYRQDTPMTPMGYCFAYQIDGDPGARLAQFGFCFFREFWGNNLVRDCVWLCLAYWFQILDVDVLYGATEANNYYARNFSRHFGFNELGIAPKFLRTAHSRIDGRIVFLEKEKFLPLLENWRKRNTCE